MLTLITGKPGDGKTLWTIDAVRRLAAKEAKRPVFYSGIQDLMLPWTELEEAEKWPTLPSGSIIVIDECQRLFRPRAHGSNVPPYVSALETHRHQGMDLYLITQDPMLVDVNVRRLVGRHFHVVRWFGAERATVHEYNGINERVSSTRDGAVARHEWSYPRDVFELYHSAELHTVRRRVPMKLWLLVSLPFVLAACLWLVLSWRAHAVNQKNAAPVPTSTQTASSSPAGKVDQASMRDYLVAQNPRIAGFPQTAPLYDEVTKPVRAPYPAACIASESKCRCYTDQATRLDTPEEVCRAIAERGFYVAWDPKPRELARADSRFIAGGSGRSAPAPAAASGVADAGAFAGPSPADQWGGVRGPASTAVAVAVPPGQTVPPVVRPPVNPSLAFPGVR